MSIVRGTSASLTNDRPVRTSTAWPEMPSAYPFGPNAQPGEAESVTTSPAATVTPDGSGIRNVGWADVVTIGHAGSEIRTAPRSTPLTLMVGASLICLSATFE